MDYYPIFMNLRGRSVVVAGGGTLALQRVRQLLTTGAHIELIAETLSPELIDLVHGGAIDHSGADFTGLRDLSPALVFGAANAAMNRQVFEWASTRGIPVNVIDCPELCTFIMPAISDRSPIIIAVSTSGTSPTLARLLRDRIETLVPPAMGKLAKLVGSLRKEAQRKLPDYAARRRFWTSLLSSVSVAKIEQESDAELQVSFTTALKKAVRTENPPGEVWLVGAGPGDPELLTLKALKAIQNAEVVVYDRLVSSEILAYIPAGVERVYAGKDPHGLRCEQGIIQDLLVRYAKDGKRVVRLKGGDPFVFGRGGEEMEFLMRADIPVHVVPGITAALGCAASSGIPLTHRDHARQVLFVTGHACIQGNDLDWSAMVRPHQTLVVYMGVERLGQILAGLMSHGLDPQTSAALIAEGTTPRQKIVRGPISSLAEQAAAAGIHAPALLFVGSVTRETDDLELVSMASAAQVHDAAARMGAD